MALQNTADSGASDPIAVAGLAVSVTGLAVAQILLAVTGRRAPGDLLELGRTARTMARVGVVAGGSSALAWTLLAVRGHGPSIR